MRNHLVTCLENGKLQPFPKYLSISTTKTKSIPSPDSPWQMPRRSQRIRQLQSTSKERNHDIPLTNRFITDYPKENTANISTTKKINANDAHNQKAENELPTAKNTRKCTSDIIQNLSNIELTSAEQSILEKGLNFCPTTKSPNKTKLLDDLYFFCRKLKLKEYFFDHSKTTTSSSNSSYEHNKERCELKTKIPNPYYNPQKGPSDHLSTYISAVKKDVVELLNIPNRNPSNISQDEANALKSLSSRTEIVIQNADKGGKIVIMNRNDYIKECENNLSNEEFYTKLTEDPNIEYATEIGKVVNKLKEENLISDNELKFLTENLDSPRTPIFYGLPKIHKLFSKFPPLRPIVSHVNSCTRGLSEFLDSYLKYQAQLSSSFIRDTKHFLQKIKEINKIKLPDNSILVTMDVCSLYTNIDQEEGADACFQKLEDRSDKSIPSNTY